MTDKLDSNIDTEKQKLKDALGKQNIQNQELLGYAVMYTVGSDWNCIVPREWLLERIDDLGIPDDLAPSKPSPAYAYKRAMKRMRESWLDDDWWIQSPRLDSGEETDHRVTLDMKEGDGSYQWHVRAEIFYSEDESKQEGGTWSQHHLGYLDYNAETQEVEPHPDSQLDNKEKLKPLWEEVTMTAMQYQAQMQKLHIATDIRQMMYYAIRDHSDTVIKLRRSVYLFPAGMTDFVDKMTQLYSEIDSQFKKKGETVAVRTLEVLDEDEKREWIEEKVRESLEDSVEDILDEGYEAFLSGDTASEVVKQIRENLNSSDTTAETYNDLLEAQIEVEELLEEQKKQAIDEEKEELIERVMQQATLP